LSQASPLWRKRGKKRRPLAVRAPLRPFRK
jgi:hypothetical protein